MGTKRKKLTALVATLTNNEKGYFIKWINAIPVGTSGQSSAMFRHILRSLRQCTEVIPPPHNAHRICNYLYHSVLRSLENCLRNKTPIDRILVLFRQAKIVADRGLFGQSKQLTAKAADQCTESGLHCLQPMAMHLQRTNLLATGHHHGGKAMQRHAKDECVLARIQLHGALASRAHTELAALHHGKGMAQCPAQRIHWQDSYDVFTSEINAQWLNEQGHAHLLMAQALLAHGLGQRDEAIATLQRLLASMRHGAAPTLGVPTLVYAAHLLHRLCLHAGRHTEAHCETAALQAWADAHLPALIASERVMVLDALHLQHMALHTHGPAEGRDTDAYLRAYAQLDGRALPEGTMAHHIHSNEPRKALHHFKALMDDSNARSYHRTLTIGAELMSLTAHHALDNEALLASTVASLRKRLWVKDKPMPLSGMVRLLTHHYANCPDVRSGKTLGSWKQKLRTALEEYREREPEGYAEAGFDWVGYFMA